MREVRFKNRSKYIKPGCFGIEAVRCVIPAAYNICIPPDLRIVLEIAGEDELMEEAYEKYRQLHGTEAQT